MHRLLLFILFFSTTLSSFTQSPETYTSSEIFQQLKKLNVLCSVLYIGAHPDDENNALLPWLAKEKLYRTAYLSLTRGDGGHRGGAAHALRWSDTHAALLPNDR